MFLKPIGRSSNLSPKNIFREIFQLNIFVNNESMKVIRNFDVPAYYY